MSFSYVLAQLDEDPMMQVRFRLGDTDADTAAFQDEEIEYALGCNNDDVMLTCIDCVSALLSRLARQTEFKVGPYTEKQSTKSYEYWSKLLAELKSKLTSYDAPLMMPPTGPPIFHYDMMGVHGNANDPRRHL